MSYPVTSPPFALFTGLNPSCVDINGLILSLNQAFGVVTTGTNFSYTGNGSVGGTFAVTGATTQTGALTVTGLTTVNGGLAGGSSANIAINTNKFTVAASTGNTLIAGTLAVTSTSALTGAVTVTGSIIANGGITQAPVAAGATITLTAAKAGATVLLNTAAGSVVTLPAATGTGNIYRFMTSVTTTSAAHKILAVGSDYMVGMVNGVRTTAITPFLALVGSVYQSLQMPYAGSQPSGGIQGDWFEIQDVGAALWEVKGQFSAGTSATTPFSTATS